MDILFNKKNYKIINLKNGLNKNENKEFIKFFKFTYIFYFIIIIFIYYFFLKIIQRYYKKQNKNEDNLM